MAIDSRLQKLAHIGCQLLPDQIQFLIHGLGELLEVLVNELDDHESQLFEEFFDLFVRYLVVVTAILSTNLADLRHYLVRLPGPFALFCLEVTPKVFIALFEIGLLFVCLLVICISVSSSMSLAVLNNIHKPFRSLASVDLAFSALAWSFALCAPFLSLTSRRASTSCWALSSFALTSSSSRSLVFSFS